MKDSVVYKRPRSPYWWGNFTYKKKRYSGALDTNKKRAIQKLREWKIKVRAQVDGEVNLWSAFKEEYLQWASANKSAATLKWDKSAIRYLEEYSPNIKYVTDVTPALLDKFKSHLILKSRELEEALKQSGRKRRKQRGLGVHGINRALQSLKVMMRKAEAWGCFKTPQKWSTISKIKTAEGRIVFHSMAEIKALLEYTHELAKKSTSGYCPWETVILLGAREGMRRGEIQNLMWSDVDFDKNNITIQPKEDWHPKTYECRDIPMTKDVREHLQKIPRHGPYVLYDTYGKRFSIDSLTNYYRVKIAKKAGIDSFIHKLRHTFASHLVQNRVDLYTVSKLLGHKNILTTQIYAHLIPDTLQEAVNRLEDINSVVESVVDLSNSIHKKQ